MGKTQKYHREIAEKELIVWEQCDSPFERVITYKKTIEEFKVWRAVRFPPLGGCREGFQRDALSLQRRINLSLPTRNPNGPLPREGIANSLTITLEMSRESVSLFLN